MERRWILETFRTQQLSDWEKEGGRKEGRKEEVKDDSQASGWGSQINVCLH